MSSYKTIKLSLPRFDVMQVLIMATIVTAVALIAVIGVGIWYVGKYGNTANTSLVKNSSTGLTGNGYVLKYPQKLKMAPATSYSGNRATSLVADHSVYSAVAKSYGSGTYQ